MAEPMPKVQGGDGIAGIANLFATLSPLFGTGKKKASGTDVQTTSADPAAMAQLDELLKQVMGGGDDQAIDDMVANILTRARQDFGPNLIASNAAGIRGYSDTVRAQMANEAMARATGEAASAKLRAISDRNKTAAGLVDSKVQATRTVQTARSEQGKTGASPAGQALALGLTAAQLYAMLKKKPTSVPGGTGPASNAGGLDYVEAGSYYGTPDSSFSANFSAGDEFALPAGTDNASLIDNLMLSESAAGGGTAETFALASGAEAAPGAVDLTTSNTAGSIFDPSSVVVSDPSSLEEILASQGLEKGSAMPPARFSMPPADTTGGEFISTGGEEAVDLGAAEVLDETATEGAAATTTGTDLGAYSQYVPYAAAAYTATQGNTRGAVGQGVGYGVGNYIAGPVGGIIGGYVGGTFAPRVIESSEDLWEHEIGDDMLGLDPQANAGLLAVADPISHITSDNLTTEQKVETSLDPLGAIQADITGIEELDPLAETGIGQQVGEVVADFAEDVEDFVDEVFTNPAKKCFITTAATMNGELDNGFTLRTLREFRSSWMQETPERRAELLDYYMLAPIVVKRIDESANSNLIWQKIREEFLVPAVMYYHMDMPEQTYKVYKDMMYWARQQVGLANRR